jgi:hypothetical protein
MVIWLSKEHIDLAKLKSTFKGICESLKVAFIRNAQVSILKIDLYPKL